MRPAVPAVAAAVLLLVVPAAADAANVSVTSGRLDYVALPGERNDARIGEFGAAAQVTDENVPLTAGAGCTQEGPSFVRCSGVTRVDVELGDRDDVMYAIGSPAFTSLSVLRGGEGRDVITGTRGPDDIHGGPWDDTLTGGAGADFFYGEDGTDLVSYSDRGGGPGISATLDGSVNDGAPGEGDHVDPLGTVEMLEGGQGNDQLKGNDGPFNRLDGGLGADLLEGRGGADQLLDSGFDAESDRLDGGAGSDDIVFTTKSRGVTVDLAAGTAVLGAERNTVVNAERVFGTPEDDVMSGTAGEETFFAGLGDDWLDGRGGADDLRGEFGDDTVSYATRTAPVTATVAAFTTTFVNGEAGENDRIDRAERLEGGAGGDELMGAGGANVLTGGGGADTLRSFFGDDVLRGGEGDDQLDAGEGNDRLDGDAGADRVVGGPDDDTIAARDGATDVIDCGDGLDSTVVDLADGLSGCENNDVPARPADPPPGDNPRQDPPRNDTPPQPAADRTAPQVTLARLRATVKRKAFLKGIALGLGCDEACSVEAELRGSARSVRLARSYDVTLGTRTLALGGGTRKLTLKPKRKLVGRARRLTVQLRVTATDAAGNRTTVTRVVKVR